VPNKGDVIVKFQTLARYAFGLVSAFLLASCGGGGAQTQTVDINPIALNPSAATWYAGVKNTLTIGGGTGPFTLSSSEPGIFPVPLSTGSRNIDIVPQQPGVIDAGLQADELQVRTVNLTVRDAFGAQAVAVIKVAQNFLTGYGMFVGTTTCSAGQVCAGGETTLFFDSTFNGQLYSNHQFRIERVRGPFQFIDPLNSNNQVDAVTVTSDHEGKFTTVIRVATGIPSQVGLIKVNDKFRRIMGFALMGYFALAVVSLISAFFGVGGGFGLYGAGPLGILLCLAGVGLAAVTLALDFDSIDRMVTAGAPAKTAWLLGHGLIVTLVWLYIEILRLLAILRGDN